MRRERGVSLVEIMIAMAIMIVLILLGAPSFSTYIANTKIRSMAEVFLAGVQTARTEAIRRNTPVEFLLTNLDPTDANADLGSGNLTTDGPNWMVRTSGDHTFIEGKSSSEGGGGRSAQVSGGTTKSIAFNGFGVISAINGVAASASVTFHFTNPTAGDCAAAGGPMRCLDIAVSAGGQSRLCDPKVTSSTDTRKC